MLLDVLSGMDELKVAVAYERDGQRTTDMPASLADFDHCRPVFETLPGWSEDLTGVRRWSELPAGARSYVQFLAHQVEVPASIVSVGPDRRQTIMVSEGTRA
jgi:adenylosuccinate synthase